MKILIVSHSAEYVGGAEKSILQLAKGARSTEIHIAFCVPAKGTFYREITESGFDATVVPFSWSTDYELGDIDESLQGKADENLHAITSIAKFIRDNSIDIVLTNTATIPWAAFASKICGVPHIWFVREFLDQHFKNPGRQSALIDQLSDVVIINSEAIAPSLSANVDKHKLEVVYPTFDTSREMAKKPKSSKDIKLTLIGPVSPQKSQLTAIEAVNKLKKKPYFDKIHLSFAGSILSPEYMKKIKVFVNKEGLEDKVQFLGNVDKIDKIYNNTDITLVCSSKEAFGRSIVESMLREIPVIAANSSGPRYIIKNNLNGYLYDATSSKDLAKKINQVINETPIQRYEITRQAKTYALKEFGEQPVSKFISILKRVHKNKDYTPWLKDLGLLMPLLKHYDNVLKENQAIKKDLISLQNILQKVLKDPLYIKNWKVVNQLKKFKAWILSRPDSMNKAH